MSIVLQGSTSGSITLQEPAVAGNTVLSLPATSGTVAINGPAFSAYGSTNTSISANTNTKVPLNNEVFDTASCFDSTTNYRFTPNVAGYYQVSFNVMTETTTTTTWIYASLYKNGSAYFRGSSAFAASANYPTSAGSCLVYLNGSTDYIELYIFTNATNNLYNNSIGVSMSGSLVRAA